MAKYVIVEESYEYDDCFYSNYSEGYEIKSKLYSEEQLAEAKAEVERLNDEISSDEYFRTEDMEEGETIRPFKLVKIEE